MNPLLALRWKVLFTDPKITNRITAPFKHLFRPWLLLPMLAGFHPAFFPLRLLAPSHGDHGDDDHNDRHNDYCDDNCGHVGLLVLDHPSECLVTVPDAEDVAHQGAPRSQPSHPFSSRIR